MDDKLEVHVKEADLVKRMIMGRAADKAVFELTSDALESDTLTISLSQRGYSVSVNIDFDQARELGAKILDLNLWHRLVRDNDHKLIDSDHNLIT